MAFLLLDFKSMLSWMTSFFSLTADGARHSRTKKRPKHLTDWPFIGETRNEILFWEVRSLRHLPFPGIPARNGLFPRILRRRSSLVVFCLISVGGGNFPSDLKKDSNLSNHSFGHTSRLERFESSLSNDKTVFQIFPILLLNSELPIRSSP